MTKQAVKVGDVVAWDEVPSGALILETDGFYSQRLGNHGRVMALAGYPWQSWNDVRERSPWGWVHSGHEHVTIIALNLTGNETADELRALAEQFERDRPATA